MKPYLPLPPSPVLKKKLTKADLIKMIEEGKNRMVDLLEIDEKTLEKWTKEAVEHYAKLLDEHATIEINGEEYISGFLVTYMWLQILGLKPTIGNFTKVKFMQSIFQAEGKREAMEQIALIAVPLTQGLGG